MVIIKAKTWPVWQCKVFSPRVVSFFDYSLGTKFFSGIDQRVLLALVYSGANGVDAHISSWVPVASNQAQLITH